MQLQGDRDIFLEPNDWWQLLLKEQKRFQETLIFTLRFGVWFLSMCAMLGLILLFGIFASLTST